MIFLYLRIFRSISTGTQHVDPCPQEHTPLLSERKNLKVFKESATSAVPGWVTTDQVTAVPPNKAGGC